VGEKITITGRLSADGAPLADVPVTLYEAGDVAKQVPVATTSTDASGYYQFTLTGDAAGNLNLHRASTTVIPPIPRRLSSELSVTYVMIPTVITATASPHKQYVGQEITVTGQAHGQTTLHWLMRLLRFTRGMTSRSRLPSANDLDRRLGYYQFTLTGDAAGNLTYIAQYDGDTTHPQALSSELSVTYVIILPLSPQLPRLTSRTWDKT